MQFHPHIGCDFMSRDDRALRGIKASRFFVGQPPLNVALISGMQSGTLAGLEILIVDDEPLLRRQVAAQLEKLGAEVTAAADLTTARKFIADQEFDFVFLDVNLPDGLGTELLKEKVFPPNTAVIVMTAEAGVAGAVEAIRLGAADYLSKPFDPGELPLVLARARRTRQSARVEEHRRETTDRSREFLFFGAALAALERQLEKILTADRRLQTALPPVLIQGETGTGKTTVARWLHNQGPRAHQPLVEVNCSALPETLAESELFGHERGAFTDARSARMGLFEAANGGTLFLDELPSLSPGLQAKVLTAIEDGRIRRVGSQKPIPVDARLIAATNQDLQQLVAEGKFREDLYHRLDLFRVIIPPLRERKGDVVKLADLMISRLCARHRLPQKKISAAGRERLMAYPWPGNVRELAHELERGIVFEEGDELHFEQLAANPRAPAAPSSQNPNDWFNSRYAFPPEGFSLEDAINRLIQHALKQSNNNVSAAARLLGVSRDYIRYRLQGEKRD
ncbi:MAG TPA: sigma-54 dependent transcriptional regulator [Verrucomicrobiae bacterium]|nr:sigma-54 dependent transcriptional regulator [Verrucomicrobiae bacterium]